MSEGELFNPDPTAYIPHRDPFLFIDRITAMEVGVRAAGELAMTGGYFPPLLLVEAMAQIAGIAAGQTEGKEGVLAALDRVTLPQRVNPKGRLSVESRVVRSFGSLVLVEGEVREDERKIASATLTLAIGER